MKKSMRRVTLAIAMLPLLMSVPALAVSVSPTVSEIAGFAKPVQTAFADGPLSGWGAVRTEVVQPPLQLAQAVDPRVGQLQEEIRQLSGKVEELNFQILQLQDQLRKTQEDNEFRFQELEKDKRSDAGGTENRSIASAASSTQDVVTQNEASQDASSSSISDVGTDSIAIGSDLSQSGPVRGPIRGQGPQTLGTIRFDANGNVIGESLNVVPAPVEQGVLGSTIAALPSDDNPNSLYGAAYQYLMSGDYGAAETGFREHIKRYPADPATAEARYWLGESLFGQGRYQDAATIFLDTQRDYPDSKRAPENMLKLGITLEKLNNRDVACATFKQIPERYPQAVTAVLNRVAEERNRNKCG